jgi:hypothetical protein
MAILDANLLLSNAQAITVTAASQNVFDLAMVGVGNAPPNAFGTASVFGEDIGGGGPHATAPQILAIINTAFAAAGAATLNIQLQASVDSGSPGYTPSNWETIAETGTLSIAQLAGTLLGNADTQRVAAFTIPRRAPGQQLPRFYRLNYVVATGPMTAGAISAFIATGLDDTPVYPMAY